MSSRIPSPHARTIHAGLRASIVAVLVAGVVARNVSVILNAGIALGVTTLPALLERDLDVRLGVGMTVWITAALALHSVGMVALYDTIPWWDHLTHLVSGTLVAGVGYATVRALDEHSDRIVMPGMYLGLFVVLFTMAGGVVWELLEHGGREVARSLDMAPILNIYGIEDTIMDLLFDGLGGLVVALLGGPYLEGTTARLSARLGRDRA